MTKRQQKRPSARPAKPHSGGDPNVLVNKVKADQSIAAAAAEMMIEGLAANAVTARAYSRMLGTLDMTECMAGLVTETKKVQAGDLKGAEAILIAQAVTLNAMFTQLALHNLQDDDCGPDRPIH